MDVWERLPDDLSMERRMVVTYALALVDKVDYFWGGKSLVLGWDDRWGELTEVTAEGSDSTGTEQPYGLDCSGFVDWAFYNASGGEYVIVDCCNDPQKLKAIRYRIQAQMNGQDMSAGKVQKRVRFLERFAFWTRKETSDGAA